MDEEFDGFGYDDGDYEGFGEDAAPAPQEAPPAAPPPAPSASAQAAPPGPAAPGPVLIPPDPPVEGGQSAALDVITSVLRIAGGAALGYCGSSDEDERMRNAALGAVAVGGAGVFGAAAFAFWLSRKRGR